MRLIIGNVQSPANPLLRAVSLVVGAILFLAALFFGALILAFVIGFVVILAAVGAAHVWWIRRKLAKTGGDPHQAHSIFMQTNFGSAPQSKDSDSRVIEGEYSDVSEDDSQRRR